MKKDPRIKESVARTATISLRVTPKFRRELNKAARELHLSRSDFIIMAARHYLNEVAE